MGAIDFDHLSDEALVELLGLDEIHDLYTNVIGGKAFITVCDGEWIKEYDAPKWQFQADEAHRAALASTQAEGAE